MRIYCDLYLESPTNDRSLKFLEILDKDFNYKEQNSYSEYLNVSIERLKLIPLINILNSKKILSYSVPLQYKTNTIPIDKAFNLAEKHNTSNNLKVIKNSHLAAHTPLFWVFRMDVVGENPNGLLPNPIYVDKLDGHIWTIFEYDKYMYDFNNRF